MKRIFVMVLMLGVLLTGCTTGSEEGMFVKPAELTEGEKEVLTIAGVDHKGFFDFSYDKAITGVHLRVMEYTKDEDPKAIASVQLNGVSSTDNERLFFTISDKGAVRLTIGNSSHEVFLERNFEATASTRGFLTEKIEIVPNVEMPLMVIKEDKVGNQIDTFSMEHYMDNPELLYNNEYDNTIVVSVIFSTSD